MPRSSSWWGTSPCRGSAFTPPSFVMRAKRGAAASAAIAAITATLAAPCGSVAAPNAERTRVAYLGIALSDSAPPAPVGRDSAGTASAPPFIIRTVVPRDTTRARARIDSLRLAALRRVVHAASARRIDLTEARKRGNATLEEALLERCAVLESALPLFGPIQAPLALPDAGTPIRIEGERSASEAATDRTVATARSAGSRGLDLVTTLADPTGDGIELLDWDGLDSPVEARPLAGAGDALARFWPSDGRSASGGAIARAVRRPRSTL